VYDETPGAVAEKWLGGWRVEHRVLIFPTGCQQFLLILPQPLQPKRLSDPTLRSDSFRKLVKTELFTSY